MLRTKLFEHFRLYTKCTAVYLTPIYYYYTWRNEQFEFRTNCTLISILYTNIARCWHWGIRTYYCLKLRTANRLCTNNYLTISLYTFLTCVRTILGFTLCSANFAISRVLAFLPRVYAKIIHLLKFADTAVINNFDTEKKIQTREIHYNDFMCSTIVQRTTNIINCDVTLTFC